MENVFPYMYICFSPTFSTTLLPVTVDISKLFNLVANNIIVFAFIFYLFFFSKQILVKLRLTYIKKICFYSTTNNNNSALKYMWFFSFFQLSNSKINVSKFYRFTILSCTNCLLIYNHTYVPAYKFFFPNCTT